MGFWMMMNKCKGIDQLYRKKIDLPIYLIGITEPSTGFGYFYFGNLCWFCIRYNKVLFSHA